MLILIHVAAKILAPMERHPVSHFLQQIQAFLQEERGVTAIEYALIASILGIALLPVLTNTSSGVASLYSRVQGYFDIVNGP